MQDIKEKIAYISSELSYYNNRVKHLSENISSHEKALIKLVRVSLKSNKSNKLIGEELQESQLKSIRVLLAEDKKLLSQLKEEYSKDRIESLIKDKKALLSDLKETTKKLEKLNSLEKLSKENTAIQDNYNVQRKVFLTTVNMVFSKFSTLSVEDFDSEPFLRMVNLLLPNMPSVQPVDINATIALRLLLDFLQSYSNLASIRYEEFAENHFQRFLYTLEKAEYYLELANNREVFYLKTILLDKNTDINTEVDILNADSILLFKDDDVIDDALFNIIQLNFNQAIDKGLLKNTDIVDIRKSLNYQDFSRYEQLEYFDIDEVSNSINNSIKTAQWFLSNRNSIPLDALHDLLCCFIRKVENINVTAIPNEHSLYKELDNIDRVKLTDLIIDTIALNNSYEDIHIKIALTLGSHDYRLHEIKNRIYEFSEYIANKYFYGVFFENAKTADNKVTVFLSNFDDYLGVVFKKHIQSSFIFVLMPALIDSMSWFVLNACSYGYTPIFNNTASKVTLHSKKLSIMGSANPKYSLQQAFSSNKIIARQLFDEYRTSFLLMNIDLRFSKNITKVSSQNEFNDKLLTISSDLREMRRLLVKNFEASNSVIELELPLTQEEKSIIGCRTGKIFALWQWETFSDTLGRICIGFDKDDLIEQSSKESRRDAQYARILRVNNNGKISPLETPWLTTDKMALVGVDCGVDINIYLLEKFHALFYQWYVGAAHKIKQKRTMVDKADDSSTILYSNHPDLIALKYDPIDEDNIYINEGLDILAVEHNPDSNISCPKSPSSDQNTYFNRSLKSTKLLRVLKEKFNVDVSQGKGSEINVSRVKEGGSIYRLGHHGKVVEYHANHIRKILRRLNISVDEWVMALESK